MRIPPQASAGERLLNWLKSHRAAVMAVIFWLVAILAVRQYLQSNNLTFADLTDQLSVSLRELWYGPLLYILIYLLRPLILFPAFLLTILGGNVFGTWPGFAYVLLAGTASSAIPYVVGRWFSSAEQTESQQVSVIRRFVDLLKKHPFQAMLMMRLLYFPYDAVSLAAGGLRIPFVAFFAATAIGNVAGTLSFVGIGASLEGDLGSGTLSLNPASLVFSIVVLVASLLVSRWLNRYQPAAEAVVKSQGES